MIQIIEPTVLRDWTAEDAKKHLGYAIRHVSDRAMVYVIREDYHTPADCGFARSEYATPIPGTDPAKWDWKPCKVEVPAEKAESDSAYMIRMMLGMTNEAWINQRQWIICRLSALLAEQP